MTVFPWRRWSGQHTLTPTLMVVVMVATRRTGVGWGGSFVVAIDNVLMVVRPFGHRVGTWCCRCCGDVEASATATSQGRVRGIKRSTLSVGGKTRRVRDAAVRDGDVPHGRVASVRGEGIYGGLGGLAHRGLPAPQWTVCVCQAAGCQRYNTGT